MNAASSNKPVIFLVISFFVALIYSSISAFNVYAVPMDPGYRDSQTCAAPTKDPGGNVRQTCCWTEKQRVYPKIGTTEVRYCQTCTTSGFGSGTTQDCKPKQVQMSLEQAPTTPRSVPPTAGENILQQDGGVLQQPPSQGVPPLKLGQGFLPEESITQQEQQPADQGAAEPPADGGTEPTPETLPTCRGGQVLDEETGLCVLEEPEQPEAEEPELAEELPAEERE